MSWLNTILILGATFLAVFWEAMFGLIRNVLGAQVDLLPALVVYASLSVGFPGTCAVAMVGGLLFDSLSANPLGITVLPLFVVGAALYSRRDLLLKDQPFAQFVLGLAASGLV